jgi:hypothetical protein
MDHTKNNNNKAATSTTTKKNKKTTHTHINGVTPGSCEE